MQAVAVDGAGAVAAAGYFQRYPATFGVVALINSGEHNAVVWKQSAEGTTLWAVRGGGTRRAGLYGVVVDSAGAVVAAGDFNTSPSTFGGVTLTTAGDGPDAVLWKMNTDGTTLWAVGGGGTGYSDNLYGVAVDGTDAVVAAGSFDSSTATFGGEALATVGGSDAGLWTVSAEGTTLWAVRGGGTSSDHLEGVAVDDANAVVAAGPSFIEINAVPITWRGVSSSPYLRVHLDDGVRRRAAAGGAVPDIARHVIQRSFIPCCSGAS